MPTAPADTPLALRRACAWALATARPLALWREPKALHPQLLISRSLSSVYAGLPPALDVAAPAGFAFFPFRDSDHNPALFLPHEAGLNADGQVVGTDAGLKNELRGALAAAATSSEATPAALPWPHSPQPLPHCATEAEYTALVQAGVAAMQAGEVLKVVSSRAARRALPVGFDVLKAFEQLCAAYPRAFVSLVSVAGTGTWLGATPEVLAEVTADGHFRTMALAGTQPLTPGLTPKNAIWRQKEIEEQAMVARYIVNCFKQLRLREYHETGPRTIVAGGLLHLRTDFEVSLRHVPFPNLGTDMLRLLHPTSAVGGMPKMPALDFLHRHEGYDRAYYSGFLGPVNIVAPGIARLFVNLRCLQLRPTQAILYAGTGLTVDSDPAKEWRESELKMQTVGVVLS